MPTKPGPLRLWFLADQKPGHTSQLQGLAQRLSVHAEVDIRWVDAEAVHSTWQDWLFKRWPEPDFLSPPDIVIGAGSASHGLILLARRVFGCMAAVLMRPAIPLFLYDAAIVPRHDRPPTRDNILITQGVMNTVQPRPAGVQATEHTMLIGGISKHYAWSSEQIIAQIKQIVSAHPNVIWTLTNSRRTPDDFAQQLIAEALPQIRFVPHTDTPRGWLASQLTQSIEAWVTPDSVSMVYEAITSGAATGLFSMEPLQQGRILAGLEIIKAKGLCTPFERWLNTQELRPPAEPLWEAERGATWLLARYQHWLTQNCS